MNNTFSNQTLAEKLSKLNNSQQSIETLSHWCIFHRKKAKQIVESWGKLILSSSQEQKVSFLYLANDILQNSRRKGSEFVNEFWKVLPEALKNVCENGDYHGKNVVMRLVDIWDERKVFGSRGRGLKDDILGKTPPPPESNGNSSNSIKVVRKDAHSLRIKLTVGGMPERIVTAYQSVLDEHFNEDAALNNCKAAVHLVGKMEKDVDGTCTQGVLPGSPLMSEIQEQETILKQCIGQLESAEATRAALIAQLKEALQEQESKLDLIHTQLQVAQAETEHAINLKQRIVSAMITPGPGPGSTIANLPAETASIIESSPPPQPSSTPPSQPLLPATSFGNSVSSPLTQLPQPLSPFTNSASSPPPQPSQTVTPFTNSLSTPPRLQPSPPPISFANSFCVPSPQPSQLATSFVTSLSTAEEQHKKAAADVAARLSASASSAQMLTSVLSSLAAEEAASMNGGLGPGVFTSSPPIFPADKRPKLEKPMSASDMNNAFFRHMQPQQLASLPLSLPPVSMTSMQPLSQNNCLPLSFPPPPPPLPPLPPPPPMPQYGQASGAMVNFMPYSFGGNAFTPPPPTSQIPMGLARPGAPQPPPPPLPPVPPPQNQQQQQKHQQSSTTTGFSHPPGFGFYGQLQTAPPVHHGDH